MIELFLALLVFPLLLPAFSLLLLTLAALGARYPARPDISLASGPLPRVAVLVPAHDESAHVLPTLACLQAQLGPADRLVVVADNCRDDTAELARQAGAEVVERQDEKLRGKGYALACGIEWLRADPPDVVLVIDADCVVSDHAVAAIAVECQRSCLPVQMLDLMQAGPQAGLKLRILEFAMLMKNLVRPLGTFRLGRACHLMGTGMAFPWPLIANARLADGHLAEDMKLGVALTRAGLPPRFLASVQVSSAFVQDSAAAKVQKSRWEHGHLATMQEELPGLLAATLRQRTPELLVLLLDLLIPPLALYLLLLAGLLPMLMVMAWYQSAWIPAAMLGGLGGLAFMLAVGLSWLYFGRQLLSWRELLLTPLYAVWKLPVYAAFAIRQRSAWIRTRRNGE
ncbi:Putative glycosyl transferase family 2 [Laribacter hongkongensis HLHK9]|uniref:Glycosyl transferase family 2 n=1 Tax=Laribacter hongkongensis (strain HLHK9) TaxID=557598 RepID=C1D4N4_LARHH|nr:glycosyltransferase family 2 protein [Laribacter hongkongensis]ACO73828.1 Putative glycosyl transferase family 2 [Laribacter hongkongensis HLHK9]